MLPRLAKATVVMSLACSIGLHWAFLQSLAWVGMVVTYSQDASLPEALAKTFDGKHPCPLCKEIAKTKRSENGAEVSTPLKKRDFLLTPLPLLPVSPTQFWLLQTADFPSDTRCLAPPTPPPREVLV